MSEVLEAVSDAPARTVEVGLRGLPFSEELIHFVRRCCERSETPLATRLRWKVEVHRPAESEPVRVCVTAHRPDGTGCRAEGADLDEILAIRNAFARIDVELGASLEPLVAGARARDPEHPPVS
ncbi:MAG TPA: hypothetical protein RMH99_19775 [Sandaracinaceae bacterium LLY-WYZ-13_1]|nr:hypothetical protein [Sandaracinaceae bacterium LLY-WYZ-13_1]